MHACCHKEIFSPLTYVFDLLHLLFILVSTFLSSFYKPKFVNNLIFEQFSPSTGAIPYIHPCCFQHVLHPQKKIPSSWDSCFALANCFHVDISIFHPAERYVE